MRRVVFQQRKSSKLLEEEEDEERKVLVYLKPGTFVHGVCRILND